MNSPVLRKSLRLLTFVKILNNCSLSKLNEIAFCGLMNEHAMQKKLQATNAEIGNTQFLPAKMILTLIEQYCNENFKDQLLKKDKMILYMKLAKAGRILMVFRIINDSPVYTCPLTIIALFFY